MKGIERYLGGRIIRTRRGFHTRSVRWIELDWHVLFTAGLLLAFGVSFLRAMALTDIATGQDGIDFDGHLKKLAVATPAFLLGLFVRPSWLRSKSFWIYGFCILLLFLVPIVGEERNNARRWIPLPIGFDLQPSEIAKLGLILCLARVLERRRLQQLGEWVQPILLALLPMALVATQPDLGTALTIVPVTIGMLYLAGARAGMLIGAACAAVLFGLVVFQTGIGVRDYQMERIETWLDSYEPEQLIEQKRGAAFHLYQARVALGNGGWTGRGLGGGVANETGYLPERSSDSIIAVVGEEVGFVGTTALLLVYVLMILSIMHSASSVRERYSRLVVGGVALYFAAHLFLNASVNIGLLPMTGLCLPLFSTGGSSLLVTFAALGLALGLAANQERNLDGDAFRDF